MQLLAKLFTPAMGTQWFRQFPELRCAFKTLDRRLNDFEDFKFVIVIKTNNNIAKALHDSTKITT